LNFDYSIFPSDKSKVKDLVPDNLVDDNGNPISKSDISVSGLIVSIAGITWSSIGKLLIESKFTPCAQFGLGDFTFTSERKDIPQKSPL
jgi:hypothetical protein